MAGVAQIRRRDGTFYPRWRGWYKDYNEKRVWFLGVEDGDRTLAIARRLEDENVQIRLGYRPPPRPADTPRRFADVLEEYFAWGEAQGGRGGRPWAAGHARNRRTELAWWKQNLSVEMLRDLNGILARVERLLQGLQRAGRTGKTVSNYAEALAAFCDWCVDRGYLEQDPLRLLRRYDASPQKKRRALTVDEIQTLLAKCRRDRQLVYETAIMSGLRAGELIGLTVSDLDTKNNGLRLNPAWTKNRKPGFQPLPADLVKRLAESCAGRDRAAPLFGGLSHPGRSLEYDLKLVGIDKKTDEGVVDFHALRTTFATLVVESGANVREAQVLMRHSTPQLTMNTYAKVRPDRLGNVAEKLGATVSRPAPCAAGVQQDKTPKGGDDVKG